MKKHPKQIDLMLDSGVFSAYSRGTTLDLKKYIAYVKANKQHVMSYVNMDDIPGNVGKLNHTQAETEKSAEKSYDNLQEMKAAGLSPIPVFHRGEPERFLERMLADGEKYIGFAAGRDNRLPKRIAWLDRMFDAICDSQGRPLIKTHGFGITQTTLLTRYPWFSADSTTWKITPGYGLLIVPRLNPDGSFDYERQPYRIPISGREHNSPLSQGRQFDAFVRKRQRNMELAVRRFLEVECGTTNFGQVRYDLSERFRCGLVYFQRLAEHLQHRRFNPKHKPHSLFIAPKTLKHDTPIKFDHLKLVFVTLARDNRMSKMLSIANANTRLLSYYELMQMPDGSLQKYVEQGTIGEWVPKAPARNWSEAHQNYVILQRMQRANYLNARDDDDETEGTSRSTKRRGTSTV